MGGLAFSHGQNPLYTPRMSLAVYLEVQKRCHQTLSQHFDHVATPIEAPGKKDYGDVDFLVEGLTALCNGRSITDVLSEVFHAERSIRDRGSPTASFALPWPKDMEKANATDHESNQAAFVQVDVHMCPDKEGWEWEIFQHAHGDLWNILGSTIRKFGLTVNNIGLFLRIEEIERMDRKRSMVFLTSKPSDVLGFLGLDEGPWWKRFDSAQDMFEYAATCRFFWADDTVKEVDEDKKALKHNDRKRMNQRSVFKLWVEEFIPNCRTQGKYNTQGPPRDQVKDEAFDAFGVRDEYDKKLTAWRREKQTEVVWRQIIKEGIPSENVDPHLRAASIRGLKAIIIDGDVRDSVIPSESLKTKDDFYDIDVVQNFVERNWQEVGRLQLEKQDILMKESQARKVAGRGG